MAVSKTYVRRKPEQAIALYDLALAVSQRHLCHTLLVKAGTISPGLGRG